MKIAKIVKLQIIGYFYRDMKAQTLIIYLEFLKTECLRHQNDKIITDDEINQFKIEIKGFIDKMKKTLLSQDIKKEILNIDFNLNEENHNHSKFKVFKLIGGFQGKEFREQENRKQRFSKLYNDIDSTLFKIKTII
ncbi:hypothetical protein LPB03_11490 [Polaribacter vadi]|uniref:Uncharacterized protein n=1 Tax=Polaribacter vadi TaxID=1774273 RepID=A0A1B8TTH9_9FLAO|nr:hypothetical protein [Polaribacter vadi]AOW18038.1 hypothetical protein LPB03_11490 [Polaribacter vadi]OBY62765.1 hypothetical protein LPB3_11500 [Polaribacter vadi]